LAGALAVAAAERPDVARARDEFHVGRSTPIFDRFAVALELFPQIGPILDDFAEPAVADDGGDGQGGDGRRRDALLRVDAGVRRLAEDFHLPALRPDRPNCDRGGRAAVEVEAHGRAAEVGQIDLAGAVQAALLTDG